MQFIEYSLVSFFIVPFSILLVNSLFSRQFAEKCSIGLAFIAPITQIATAVAGFVLLSRLQEREISIIRELTGAVSVHFAVNAFSLVILFCIGLVSLASILVAHRTVDQKRTTFVNLLMVLILGMNGMVMVTDLFSFMFS